MRSLLACCIAISLPALVQAVPPSAVPEKIEFNRDIRPILAERCLLCHGPAKATRKADLRLDTEEGAFADLGGHRAIVPGKLDQSELWKRVTSSDATERMPPSKHGKPLAVTEIALLKRWIEQGARFQQHWAFVPPQRPALPVVQNKTWPKTGIDHFILARLEAEKLTPSPQAARETLLRRVTLDLTGLPPTLAELDAFLADQSAEAYGKVVDRLLASPRYGERMVLDWLDAARYADSNGYQTDGTRAMWPWRDWVIDALNKNMPFDQFTLEQIAGDLLPNATIPQKIATGFHRNHMLNGEGGRIAEESRVDYVVDRVETTGTVWLGLTAGCARCHDHKYDPLSQREFYQMAAYFNSINESGGVDRRSGTAAPTIELATPEQQQQIAAKTKELEPLDKQLKVMTEQLAKEQPAWEKSLKTDKLPPDVAAALKIEPKKRDAKQAKAVSDHHLNSKPELQKLRQQQDQAKKALDGLKNSVLITMIMEERPQPRDTFILERGIYNKYGAKVSAGLPAVLPPLPKDAPNNRLGLARWLIDPANPLTARVTVNRHWQMFFGTGLVRTAEDFGSRAEQPSHPELLDWLATEFVRTGWDVKALHKLIVTSAAYRQTAQTTPQIIERDPDNRWLTRGPRMRLSALLLRDQALALSGLLVEKTGGPPVRPYQPPNIWEEFSFNQIKYVQSKGQDLYRRSLYTFWRRSVGPTNFFDVAPRQVCTVRQPRTNTPIHALILMNDVTYVEAARAFAERIMKQAKAPEERLSLAFRMATARQPNPQERQVLLSGLQRVQQQYQSDKAAALKLVQAGESRPDAALDVVELAAYTALANMILNLDEVVTKE